VTAAWTCAGSSKANAGSCSVSGLRAASRPSTSATWRARHHERADRALLVTTGYVTRQGYAWVRGKPITLWDGAILARHLAEQRQRMEHPDWQQEERRRARWFLGSLAAVNASILLWAAVSAPIFVPAHPVTVHQPDAATRAAPVAEQPIPVREAATPDTCGTATIRGVERLVLRSAPGLQSAKLADYPAGTIVTLTCASPIPADGLIWQQVQVADQEGWMSQRMLK
jgi:hypothetical protein